MTDFPAQITFELPANFSVPDNQIFVTVVGQDPNSPILDAKFGYVDFKTNTLQANWTLDNFQLDPATMVQSLAQIKAVNPNGQYTINIPRVRSGRIYFAFWDNFSKIGGFSSSGPTTGKNNPVMYDKMELDTASAPGINATYVDFFSIAYKLRVTDSATGKPRLIGTEKSQKDIVAAFNAIPASSDSQQSGNTGIFEQLILKNDQSETVRILAPKSAGLTDWGGTTLKDQINNATRSSHFWDDYINNQCWKPGRKFSCYSKNHNPSNPDSEKTIYYGEVSANGQTLKLYTDAARTVPYTVPSLPRPSNPWGVPDFSPPPPDKPSLYQNTNSAQGPIDWGYLLFGNAGFPSGLGQYWANDAVAMAIVVSILRGVMHYDDGCDKWTDPSYFYQGTGQGTSTSDFPIFYYSKILHDISIDNKAYVLGYDDVYGNDSFVSFGGYPDITITFIGD